MTAEDLIGSLSAGLEPVKPISPWRRGLALTAGSLALVAAVTLVMGLRPDLHRRLEMPDGLLQWGASLATGVLALFAAALLAQPDRSRRWALLPLPAGLLWLAALGLGCLADLRHLGASALTIETSWGCVRFIVLLGLPLTGFALLSLRHAWPMRAVPVTAMSGLGAAGLCSAGLSLFHHLDAALMVLVWHGMAALLLVLLSGLLGLGLPRQPRRGAAGPS